MLLSNLRIQQKSLLTNTNVPSVGSISSNNLLLVYLYGSKNM